MLGSVWWKTDLSHCLEKPALGSEAKQPMVDAGTVNELHTRQPWLLSRGAADALPDPVEAGGVVGTPYTVKCFSLPYNHLVSLTVRFLLVFLPL